MDFERRLDGRFGGELKHNASQRKQTARKPEEVKFRTVEEERASLKMQVKP